MSEPPRLEMRGVARRFRQAGARVEALAGVSFSLAPGEAAALVGASGSGKSTLLQIAGLLDRPDEGAVLLDGRDASRAGERERTALRRRALGFVYQSHHLLADFSALENLAVPQRIAGVPPARARRHARELLEIVGLGDRLSHRPARLSGGEQQRVALCRAVVNRPRLVLADEPTGNLDPGSAEEAFALLMGLVRASGASALVATHNLALAARMDRELLLERGGVRDARAAPAEGAPPPGEGEGAPGEGDAPARPSDAAAPR